MTGQMMKRVTKPAELRAALSRIRDAGMKIGFVPTMGALHEGHESLVRMAREKTGFVVVSIFVNPTQFGPKEDFEEYPRPLEEDCALLERSGCDIVFLPSPRDIYSPGGRTRLTVKGLGERLCGISRPGHFDGVLLIVAKLFNIVSPDYAFFGQKDAQQAVILQRMAADLDFPVRIIVGKTVREADGLAMSSRNTYLATPDREKAAAIYRGLMAARSAVKAGERNPGILKGMIRGEMERASFIVDYVEIVKGETMDALDRIEGTVLIAVAGRISGTRLIDNIALRVEGGVVEEVTLEYPEWSRYDY